MLTNFLEHTRIPEEIVSAASDSVPVENLSNSAAASLSRVEAFLRMVQSDPGGPELSAAEVDQVISLLRFERYIDNAISREHQSGIKAIVRQAYYMLRPLFPVAFRKHLQRIALRGWDSAAFPAWPVDVTTEKCMEVLWQRLLSASGLERLPFIWFWPEGRPSACIMTHDVETGVGRDFCATLMKMESRYGITSAFEVVPEERYAVPDEFLEEIRSGGCEVCIHGLNHDGHLFSTKEIFLSRAEKINEYARKWGALGFRSPVLYRNLDWLNALSFPYDMTVPTVGHLDPQRGGCCTVMPYFIGDILELPLTTTQDYSLFHILQQGSLDLWMRQITTIRENHGLVSFIIHPDYVNEPWSSALYDGLLRYLAELRSDQNLWIALPREVNDWWRARRQMRLVRRDSRWEIVGPEADRACVAYASLSKGKVVYSVEKNKYTATT